MTDLLSLHSDRTHNRRHPANRLLLISGAAAAAIAGSLTYLLWPAHVAPGPMASYGENGIAIPTTAGQHTTWGTTLLQNNGRRTIVLDALTIKASDPTLVGRIAVPGPNRNVDTVSTSSSFPPNPGGGLHLLIVPLRGATIAAGKLTYAEVEVVAPHDGRFTLGPVTVYYHVGDTNYRITLPSYEIVCAPRSAPCEPPHP